MSKNEEINQDDEEEKAFSIIALILGLALLSIGIYLLVISNITGGIIFLVAGIILTLCTHPAPRSVFFFFTEFMDD